MSLLGITTTYRKSYINQNFSTFPRDANVMFCELQQPPLGIQACFYASKCYEKLKNYVRGCTAGYSRALTCSAQNIQMKIKGNPFHEISIFVLPSRSVKRYPQTFSVATVRSSTSNFTVEEKAILLAQNKVLFRLV